MEQAHFNMLTRTKMFRKLTKKAFEQCDKNKTGKIGKTELYTGIILVHLQLAKYVGPAACSPPSRETIDKLFDASDDDKSGYIDENEFAQIMVICFGQITSRIAVYMFFMVLLVPYVAGGLVSKTIEMEHRIISHRSLKEYATFLSWVPTIIEKAVATTLGVMVVPAFFDWIDTASHEVAEKIDIKPATTGVKKID